MIRLGSTGFEAVARIALAVATALTLSACAGGSSEYLAGVPPVPSTPIRDNLIVPGHRAGPVSLGMELGALYSAMGSPQETVVGDLASIYKYPGLDIWVNHSANKVTSITVTRTDYSTDQGVRVGASELEVRAKYGRPLKFNNDNQASSCYREGIGFYFRNGAISAIVLVGPGCP